MKLFVFSEIFQFIPIFRHLKKPLSKKSEEAVLRLTWTTRKSTKLIFQQIDTTCWVSRDLRELFAFSSKSQFIRSEIANVTQFFFRIPAPKYTFAGIPEGGLQQIIVKKETAEVRPFVVGAVLRNIKFDAENYASFIDLQDKLHQNICRKRTLVAIGTHDLDTIQGPFEYRAVAPKDIKFKPLNQTKEYTAEELMTLYSSDSHLKAYLPIIQDRPRYPVIYDKNEVVCSMPPIINGEHSKITLNTKNVFIEATATDKQKAFVVLDTIVSLFSQYCAKPFTVEQVEVIYEETGVKEIYPLLSYREMTVTTPEINTKIGVNLKDEEIATLLNKMSLKAEVLSNKTLKIVAPPTRHDILHACDIAEDVGVAYGYNNLITKLPEVLETFLATQILCYLVKHSCWSFPDQ